MVVDDRVDAVIACVRESARTGHPGDGRAIALPVPGSIGNRRTAKPGLHDAETMEPERPLRDGRMKMDGSEGSI